MRFSSTYFTREGKKTAAKDFFAFYHPVESSSTEWCWSIKRWDKDKAKSVVGHKAQMDHWGFGARPHCLKWTHHWGHLRKRWQHLFHLEGSWLCTKDQWTGAGPVTSIFTVLLLLINVFQNSQSAIDGNIYITIIGKDLDVAQEDSGIKLAIRLVSQIPDNGPSRGFRISKVHRK